MWLHVIDTSEHVFDSGALGTTEPRLIVVDTQALATPGADENSNRDMGLVLTNMKRLSTAHGCFVLLVHHTGYDTSHSRGASAQRCALDSELRVADGALTVTKVKSYKPSKPLAFDLVSSGRESVWARYNDDWQTVLWQILRDGTPGGGLTVVELAAHTFDDYADSPEMYDKRVERQLKRWTDRGVAAKHRSRPARWWAVELPVATAA